MDKIVAVDTAKYNTSMKITITCGECGHSHPIERRIYLPGPIHIVCHECEEPLEALMTAEILAVNNVNIKQARKR